MIQLKTFLLATDKTAIVKVYCIKVLKSSKNRIANLGDLIIICVNSINIKKFLKLKPRFQKRFNVGSMHRALIVRTKINFPRINGIFFKFICFFILYLKNSFKFFYSINNFEFNKLILFFYV